MKLQDYRNDFYTYSGKASDLNRQLGFAGIALIWLFKKDVAGIPAIPGELIIPGVLIVASLTLDMVHYSVASIIWRCFYRRKEDAGVSEGQELDHSIWLERPIWLLFVAKIGCVVAAYCYLFSYLIKILIDHTT